MVRNKTEAGWIDINRRGMDRNKTEAECIQIKQKLDGWK